MRNRLKDKITMETTMNISKIQIIFCVAFLSMWMACGKTMPFDCATPIILGPILRQMRSVDDMIEDGKNVEKWHDPAKWPSLQYVFEISECPLPKGEKRYDRIVQVKYDRVMGTTIHFDFVGGEKGKTEADAGKDSSEKDGRNSYSLTKIIEEENIRYVIEHNGETKGWPNVDALAGKDILDKKNEIDYKVTELVWEKKYSHVFRLYVKDGLIVKLGHWEPSGVENQYDQSILEEANGIQFEDAEYTKLSKESLLSVYKGECLWLRLPAGRHQAEIRLQPVGDILPKSKKRFWGMLLFPDKPLTVDFEFFDNHVRHLYITSRRGNDPFGRGPGERIIYYIMNRWEAQDGHFVLTDAVFYDKWSNTDLSVHFHRNLGLKDYCKSKRGVLTDMLQWEENGANRKCVTVAEQKKVIEEVMRSLGVELPKE